MLTALHSDIIGATASVRRHPLLRLIFPTLVSRLLIAFRWHHQSTLLYRFSSSCIDPIFPRPSVA